MWSAASPLTFIEVTPNENRAHIKIKFGVNAHGDSSPFDGPGKCFYGTKIIDKREIVSSLFFACKNALRLV